MFKTRKLAKEIYMLGEEIKQLESKRSRSMACIMEAYLSNKQPDDVEVQFFRTFSAEIDVKREQLQDLTKQLEGQL